MLTPTALYQSSLPFPHRRETLVRVTDINGVVLMEDVPIVDGTVTAALNSTVTRSCQLTVDPSLFPEAPTDALSPFKAVLHVFSGIGYPDGSRELFPLFTGRVYEASRAGDGTVSLRADDLAADVVGFRFEQPQSSQTSITVVQQIAALIRESLPQAVFGTDDVEDIQCPPLTWDDDRGSALDDLAAAVQGRWYTLGDGSFVVRKYPYALGSAVIDLTDGTGGYPILVDATQTVTRDATANSVTVIAERMDGTVPVRQQARDSASTSPTLFGGTFGRVSQIIRVQTPLAAPDAFALAASQLQSSLALTEQWRLTCTPIHTLEPGDTINIRYRGVDATQVIDSWSIPLTTGNSMNIATRSSVSPTV